MFVRIDDQLHAVTQTELRQDPRDMGLDGALGQHLDCRDLGVRQALAEGTVKTHISRILSKLGLRDRVQLVVYAYEHGLA